MKLRVSPTTSSAVPRPLKSFSTRENVRRNLFDVTKEEARSTDAWLQKQLKDMQISASQKWSYDFANDRPIQGGRYEWVPATDLPPAYAMRSLDASKSTPSTPKRSRIPVPSRKRLANQLLLTEFFPKTKRARSASLSKPNSVPSTPRRSASGNTE